MHLFALWALVLVCCCGGGVLASIHLRIVDKDLDNVILRASAGTSLTIENSTFNNARIECDECDLLSVVGCTFFGMDQHTDEWPISSLQTNDKSVVVLNRNRFFTVPNEYAHENSVPQATLLSLAGLHRVARNEPKAAIETD